MYTKQDFEEAIKQSFLTKELTAALYQVSDPRIMQIMDAQATMLAMLSQQVEVAMQEPFSKARDATVLSDAAAKGLIFTAKPCRVTIYAVNEGNTDVVISSGRNVIDSSGRYYQITETQTVKARSDGLLTAEQIQIETQTHTVEDSDPFYSIAVSQPKDGSAISYLQVKVNDEVFSPSYKFNGVEVGDKVYHVESDEFKQLSIKFGASGIIGTAPNIGDVVTIEKGLTFGDITPEIESPFSLQYVQNQNENNVKFYMAHLLRAGTSSASMSTLRELVKYPSIYDSNAVFLGEFDVLLRSKFSNLAFLSVWNEAKEETARGANQANVNKLFVSFSLLSGSTLEKAAVQDQIEAVIQEADDSYRVKFVEPVTDIVSVTVGASVSRSYDSSQTISKAKEVILNEYGRNAYSVKQGKVVIKHKDISDLLRNNVPAFADTRGDIFVNVSKPQSSLPEVYRYVDENSIQLNLSFDDYDNNIVWGGGYGNR